MRILRESKKEKIRNRKAKNNWNHIQDHRWLYTEMVSKENTPCDRRKLESNFCLLNLNSKELIVGSEKNRAKKHT
jgi:hypothetical protein